MRNILTYTTSSLLILRLLPNAVGQVDDCSGTKIRFSAPNSEATWYVLQKKYVFPRNVRFGLFFVSMLFFLIF